MPEHDFSEELRLAEAEREDPGAPVEYARKCVLRRQSLFQKFVKLEYDAPSRTFTCVVKPGATQGWRDFNRLSGEQTSFILQFAHLQYQCDVHVREEEEKAPQYWLRTVVSYSASA